MSQYSAFLTESRQPARPNQFTAFLRDSPPASAPPTDALTELHARRDAAVSQLVESLDITGANVISPLDRWFDGDRLITPAGTLQDRRHGSDSPVVVNEQQLATMRSFSRVICEANGYAIGFLDHLTNYIVGPGFTWQVKPRGGGPADPDGSGPAQPNPLVKAAQDALDEFRVAAEWGHGEEDRETETFLRLIRDGEAFLRLFRGERGKVPVLRSVEPEQIGCPQSKDQMSPWSWGILTEPHDVETRLAYWVKNINGTGGEGEEVGADRMLHIKGNTDRTVKRGIPDFWPVADGVEGSRKLVRNMNSVAAIQAAIAWVREHAPTTTADQVNRMIQTNQDGSSPKTSPAYGLGLGSRSDNFRAVQGMEAGTRLDISSGMKYVAGPAAAGTPGFVQVLQASLRAAGARWNMPEYFSGDASNANFASTMVSGSPFVKAGERRQKKYKAFQEKLGMRVLELCEESGRVPAGTCEAVMLECTPPPIAIGNPLQDHQIHEGENRAGVLSVKTWQEMRGYDPEVENANRRQQEDEFPPGGAGGPQFPLPGDDGDPFGGGGGSGSGGTGGALPESRRKPPARQLLAEGFTGTKRDSLGRKIHFVDGKRVSDPAGVQTARAAQSPRRAAARDRRGAEAGAAHAAAVDDAPTEPARAAVRAMAPAVQVAATGRDRGEIAAAVVGAAKQSYAASKAAAKVEAATTAAKFVAVDGPTLMTAHGVGKADVKAVGRLLARGLADMNTADIRDAARDAAGQIKQAASRDEVTEIVAGINDATRRPADFDPFDSFDADGFTADDIADTIADGDTFRPTLDPEFDTPRPGEPADDFEDRRDEARRAAARTAAVAMIDAALQRAGILPAGESHLTYQTAADKLTAQLQGRS